MVGLIMGWFVQAPGRAGGQTDGGEQWLERGEQCGVCALLQELREDARHISPGPSSEILANENPQPRRRQRSESDAQKFRTCSSSDRSPALHSKPQAREIGAGGA